MRLGSRKKTGRLVAGIALLAVTCRALIPVGFMPSSDQPFAIVICHEGFPGALLHPEAPLQPSGGSHYEHCLFSSVTAAAPAPPLGSLACVLLVATRLVFTSAPSPSSVRLVYVPPARAPPRAI